MSSEQTRVPPKPAEGPAHRRSSRELLRTGGLVALAILITLFAVFNLHWIVGSGRAPRIIVIVISLLVGIVLT